MKEEATAPSGDTKIAGETDAFGEDFPEPRIELMEGTSAQQEQEERQQENERQAMLAMLTPMVEGLCNIVVARMEGAPPVTNAEAVALTDRLWAIAEYYDFHLSDAWALWFGLAATAGSIFGPRIVEAKRYAKEKARRQQGATPSSPDETPEGRGMDSAGDWTEGVRQDDEVEGSAETGKREQSSFAGVYP